MTYRLVLLPPRDIRLSIEIHARWGFVPCSIPIFQRKLKVFYIYRTEKNSKTVHAKTNFYFHNMNIGSIILFKVIRCDRIPRTCTHTAHTHIHTNKHTNKTLNNLDQHTLTQSRFQTHPHTPHMTRSQHPQGPHPINQSRTLTQTM